MEIGSRLKTWITEEDIPLREFVEKVRINPSSLSHFFSGRNNPSTDVLVKIKKAYPKLDLTWLLTGDKSFPAQEKETAASTEITKVNYTRNVDSENDQISDNQKHRYLHMSNDRSKEKELIGIIELYSDGTFKKFDAAT
jgi:transcriptional regulator with XRE-family HTH domain